jgi:hypothetical protein
LTIGGIITFVDHKRKNPWGKYGSPSAGWDQKSDDLMKRIGNPLWIGGLIFFVWVFVLVLTILLVDVYEFENHLRWQSSRSTHVAG